MASARAIATRWAWPPESWRGLRSASSPMPKRSSQARASASASLRWVPRARGPKATLARARQVREEELPLEDQPHGPVAGRDLQQVDPAEPGVALGRHQAGQRPHQGRLPGAVGADHRQHLPGAGLERGLHPVGDAHGDVEALGAGHGVPSQRSRSARSTPIDTSSITMLNASAASWSDWRVT